MYKNTILRSLPADELTQIQPRLEPRSVKRGVVLKELTYPPNELFFVEDGVLSLTIRDSPVFAFIGREGIAGASAVLWAAGGDYRISVAVPAEVLALPTAWLEEADGLPELRFRLQAEGYRRVLQAASTAREAARHTVEQRLARLICLLHDRVDGDTIAMTHETFAEWLGVRRPGVTVATHVLEGERLIRARRGTIEIVDRPGLEKASAGAYGDEDRPPREHSSRAVDGIPAMTTVGAAGRGFISV